MPTADEVIVEFQAQVGRYQADLRRAQQVFERTTGAQQARMQSFERQMQRSSGQISSTLKGLAGAFATAFTGRELVGLIDSFTRLQNNLRVAGLEGQSLADVQRQLLDLSTRYGASVEGLSSVFLKANLAQQSLGASTEQIIQLNEIVAASLKVTGSSAAEAQGALLQLGQALGSGVVRAEEFNSILEGAFPLAQAAARGIEGYAGDVAKLRIAIADGAITSREFFEGVLRGGTQTIAEAEKATLTLSGAMEALTSQLTIYFGEAGKGSGATEALASAIEALADNLDTIIPALAIIAGALGTRYVVGAVAASGATRALVAHLQIATTSLAGTALAARSAGGALLAAFGGPVGAAVAALTVGIGYLAVEQSKATAEAERLAAAAEQNAREFLDLGSAARTAARETSGLTDEQLAAKAGAAGLSVQVDRLADSHYRAAVAARTQRIEEQRLAMQLLGKSALEKATELKSRARVSGPGDVNQRATVTKRAAGALGRFTAETGAEFLKSKEYRDFVTARRTLERMLNAPIGGDTPAIAASSAGKPAKRSAAKRPRRNARRGPDIEQIEDRFASEMANYAQQAWAAMRSTATSADERAELELRSVELARKRTLNEIAADEDYSDAQKQLLTTQIEVLAQAEREAVAFQLRAEREQEAADLAHDRHQAELDALRLQYDLADTEADRRRIALEILDAEDRYLKSKEQAILASVTASDAEKARARLALDALNSTAGARRASVERQHEGPLGRYARYSSDPAQDVEEAVARKLESVNQGISDALSDALGTDDQFVKDLFSIFLDQVIFRPLVEALDQAGGGNLLGGLFSSVTGAIFGGGRAIGGPVRAGTAYKVGEGGEELFVPQQNGVIVPNHRLTTQAGATVISSPKFDLRGAVVTAELYADMERISRANAAKAAGKAYQQSMKDAPGRVRSAQRYGR